MTGDALARRSRGAAGVPGSRDVRPADRLGAILLLLPVWWALGIEQYVYPVILLVLLTETLVRRRRFRLDPLLAVGGLYLIASLLSALFITEPARYLSFVHAFGAGLSAVAALALAVQRRPDAGDVRRFAWAIVVTASTASVLGLLGVAGVWRPALHSLAGRFLPQALAATDTGTLIAVRTVGEPAWFLGHVYFRASGTFLYGNMLAVAVALALVWGVYLWRRARSLERTTLLLALLPTVVALAFTTSRLTVAALALGATVVVFLRLPRMARVILTAILAAVLVVTAAAAFGPLRHVAEAAVLARGRGSPTHRLEIYTATVEGIAERPAFGWGTVRDTTIPGLPYPAGSHSFLLGTLYKHGLVGFAILLWFGILLWRRARDPRNDPALRDAATWILVTLAVMSVGTSFDLDATVMLMIAGSLAMVAAAARRSGALALRPTAARRTSAAPARSAHRAGPVEYRMLDVRVTAMTVADWLEAVRRAVTTRERCVMVGQNLHSVYLAHRDERLRALQERADHVRIDGLPLVWMGRSLGLPLRPEHRSGFMDLFDPLFRAAQDGRWRVFFLGSSAATCGRAVEEVRRRYPGVTVGGADGYFDLRPGSPDGEVRLDAIRAFAPDVLVVGMGMPRQEAWMLQSLDRLQVPAVVACGACMDYVAGSVRAAPRLLSRLGLEWLFRLAVEPRRLAFRYLVEPWFVLGLWLRDMAARLRPGGAP